MIQNMPKASITIPVGGMYLEWNNNRINWNLSDKIGIMNIKSWSNLIYKYYFERELGDRVILHISMQDLIDFAKDFDVEIANGRGATSFDNTFIRNDFVRKFWYTTDGNKDLKDLQKKINHIANLAINEPTEKVEIVKLINIWASVTGML